MAEEIAHYKTVEGDILNLSIVLNRKYESLGRKWSYRKLMPQKDLEKFIKANEIVYRYDLGEGSEIMIMLLMKRYNCIVCRALFEKTA